MWPFNRKTWTKWSRPMATRDSLHLSQVRYCEETGEFQLKVSESGKSTWGNITATDLNKAIDTLIEESTSSEKLTETPEYKHGTYYMKKTTDKVKS